MRVALIHYWLVNWRGGEQVLRTIADLFPHADIFTHVADPQLAANKFPGHRIQQTFIGSLPGSRKHYQKYLPLMPLALEQLDLREYDLVISSESGPAKGVIINPYATHICYCHSPMRYVWDMYHDYTVNSGRLTKGLMTPFLHYLRNWDQLNSQRVDRFIANSKFVAQRISKYYRRESTVIYPAVMTEDFYAAKRRDSYFLWVGQLVIYKRPDILVDAFNKLGERLVVIGDGVMLNALRKRASPNITFLGKQPFEVLRDHLSQCRALIFPGTEDFGIVPVEAMASGAPVIAVARGGALETVVDNHTGVLYSNNSANGLIAAVERFRTVESTFIPQEIQLHASSFSVDRFKAEFTAVVQATLGRPLQ